MKSDSIKSIIVLGSICLVVAVLLSSVNYITAPIIKESANTAVMESLKEVLPDATDFEEVSLPEGAPETVTGIFKDNGGSGYAVTLSTSSSYSQSPLTFTLGVGADGKIVAIKITNYAETKDFGEYPGSFIGSDSALAGVNEDLATGATYSATAFKNAVADAMGVLVSLGGVSEGEKTEEQIMDEIMALALPGAYDGRGKLKASEANVEIEGVISALKADNGVGYLFVAEYKGSKVICAVSASGSAAVYDLDANIVSDVDSAFVENIAAAADFSAIVEKDAQAVANVLSDGDVLENIAVNNHFGTVTSAYRSGEKYFFVAHPFGYSDTMTITLTIENGAISAFRNSGELIQNIEYYEGFEMDESAYVEGIIGKTEETLTDDVVLITGATVTGNAVNKACEDAFAVYKEVAVK